MSEITYKTYKVTDILVPHQGNAIYTKKAVVSNGWEGDIPVISSDTSNNGILCYISKIMFLTKIMWIIHVLHGLLMVKQEH